MDLFKGLYASEEQQKSAEKDRDIASKDTHIDLGCGDRKKEGYYGVDVVDYEPVDKLVDLDDSKWDISSNKFKKARAEDLFEHLDNPFNFFDELHRICVDGAKVFLEAPHLCSRNWINPDHKRLVGVETFEHFSQEDYRNGSNRFQVVSIRITFIKRKMFFWNYLIEPLVNINSFTQIWYERSFLGSLFPSLDVEAVLEVNK